MSDLRKNCNQGQQKQTLRISSPPLASRSSENPSLFRVDTAKVMEEHQNNVQGFEKTDLPLDYFADNVAKKVVGFLIFVQPLLEVAEYFEPVALSFDYFDFYQGSLNQINFVCYSFSFLDLV